MFFMVSSEPKRRFRRLGRSRSSTRIVLLSRTQPACRSRLSIAETICTVSDGVTTISTSPQMRHGALRQQLRKYLSCLESAHDLSLYDVGGMARHCTVRYGNIARLRNDDHPIIRVPR